MSRLPAPIAEFIVAHHVLGLAVVDRGMPWAASCFYAFDEPAASLIVMTSVQTRHGMAMRDSPAVAGTIGAQPERIRDIRGVQFGAWAECLTGAERRAASSLYLARHPIARLRTTDLWRLRLEDVKFTDNRLVFAQKSHWQRIVRPAPAVRVPA
ncbi:hypothetical protein WKR88_22195 [Trinickia caryophylli]|uniref:Pyridoxamine 5'-phosphate oxidase putative domain-containing protein n=1 Tax=Trinickia caryophylli TaxID=28094 RepID=A0A1X7CNP6_TRICW|nr:hypothetical protein [Trinickia caryophylli]PMS11281.1 hypothetical protein C0Z17_15815 [Trinickia caryophylli]TRX20134.1 hypothetical protein FNF07_19375 [Trinickia caryophylli]WQE12515.1 hypothetical protein U0034_03570 [Trinickia caryophylli]SMF00126.1 hypothetical protein SAMN06295900_101695 [Trinickia caryophylli]GLU30199.1 UPF0306 protein YhbP [Trinickia caryophylli]